MCSPASTESMAPTPTRKQSAPKESKMPIPGKKKILFVGEGVTLSHVARPALLAAGLDSERYDTTLACDRRYHALFEGKTKLYAIESLSPETFLARLKKGAPVFDAEGLQRSVDEDRRMLRELTPDAVVGDFRVSLSISARLENVPYFAISDGYWSPLAERDFPLPDIPVRSILGATLGGLAFKAIRPLAFRQHAAPINKVRRRAGLSSLGADLAAAYTDADHLLYPEAPTMNAMAPLPANHHHIGALAWSPQMPLPAFWSALSGRPIVYLCLGSSGPAHHLPALIESLAKLDADIVVATAGRPIPSSLPSNVFCAPYLPGGDIAARAALVVCNGGSTATQQALIPGTPVLGIASNMDQLMNMEALEKTGAGRLLRSADLSGRQALAAAKQMLREKAYTRAASRLSRELAALKPTEELDRALSAVLWGPTSSAPRSQVERPQRPAPRRAHAPSPSPMHA